MFKESMMPVLPEQEKNKISNSSHSLAPVDKKQESLLNVENKYQDLINKKVLKIFKENDIISEDAEKMGFLSKKLENSKIEINFLSALLKFTKGYDNKFDFENIKDFRILKKKIGADLSEDKKIEILEIAKENYENNIFKDNPEAARRIIEDVEKELADIKNQKTYTLKFQDKIVAFCRFKPLPEGGTYAGALNLEKEVQGLDVGKYFLDSVLSEEVKKDDIKAIARTNRVAYYKKIGFKIVGEPFTKNGVEYYNIILPKKEDDKY